MKKLLLTLTNVLFCAITFAQSVPQGINYQAVARDANGDVLMNQALTIQFSVISDIATSAISWQETQQDTTNDYGLFTAIIGQGTTTSVGSSLTFDVIDWGASHHFLKVEIDYGGGLVDMGTTAFMSVPYALKSGNSVFKFNTNGSGIQAPSDTASGSASTAMGYQTTASGTGSTAMGYGTVATGFFSTAMGIYNIGGGDSIFWVATDPLFEIGNGSSSSNKSNALTVLKNGNVGIGTTTPTAKLEVRGTGSSSATNSFLVEDNTGADIFKIRDDVRIGIGTNPNTSYQLYNNVPATSTVDYAQRNYFYRNNTKTGTMYGLYNYTKRGLSASSGTIYGIYSYAYNNVGTSSTYGIRGYTSGDATGSKYGIYSSTSGLGTRYAGYFVGDVYSSGSYLPSDESLKRNISDYDNALDQLSSIEVKEYEYKHEGDMSKMDLPKGKQVGIMAQNIETVFPQLTKDTEFDLNDDPENEDPDREENIFKFKAVNYTGMIPVTVKAIQEQQEMIKNQQELIKKLEERITELENN